MANENQVPLAHSAGVDAPTSDEKNVPDKSTKNGRRTTTKSGEPEMVSVPREEFEGLLSMVKDLKAYQDEQRVSNKPYSPAARRDLGKKVKVHFKDGKLVIAYGKTHKRNDDLGNPCLFIELVTEDNQLHIVHLLDFFNGNENHALVDVLETKTNEEIVSQGEVMAQVVEWDKYRSYFSDKMVSLDVVIKKNNFKVKLPDGREAWVNETVVN